jgi:hypothetical protein
LRTRLVVYLVSIALVLSPISNLAQIGSSRDDNLAGRIIVANGEVTAQDSSGGSRELARRSVINVGDTVFTGVGSSAQVRMVDAALVSLAESTEFAIVAYQYEENPATDQLSIHLIQGGFRTITGVIGQENPEAYSATIGEFGTIGIRGTDYEVVITPLGEIISGVYDGGTTIGNDVGQLDLGVGADYDFALVPDAETPPEGLLLQPIELGNISSVVTAESDDDDADGDDDTQTADGDGDDDGDDQNADDAQNTDGDDQNTDDNANADDNAGADADDNAGADADDNAGADGNANADAGPDIAAAALVATPAADDGGADAPVDGNLAQGLAATDNALEVSIIEPTTNNAINLAPPSAAIVAETPNTLIANAVISASEPAQNSELTVNPSETTGDGSVACSPGSASCGELEDLLSADQPDSDSPPGTDTVDGNDSGSDSNDDISVDPGATLNISDLSPAQLVFLRSLGLVADDSATLVDISNLSAAERAQLESLDLTGGTGGGPDGITTVDTNVLSPEQVQFLASLGLAPDADGFVDISRLTSVDLDNLKNPGYKP